MTLFIGDVHGKFGRYDRIIREHANTIQVGDMGVGFIDPNSVYRDYPRYLSNPSHDKMVAGNHRFIRGNHDNPSVCKRHTQCIQDGTVEGDRMFIGGALSIDRAFRVEGYTWWKDEEITSPEEWNRIFDIYRIALPRVMVTHECPESVAGQVMASHNMTKLHDPSITRRAFEGLLSIHRPEIWVFGHWHRSFDAVINGTRFVCLNELEAKEID